MKRLDGARPSKKSGLSTKSGSSAKKAVATKGKWKDLKCLAKKEEMPTCARGSI
ncbi:hypothetical protein H0O03_05015 [Candidatus Micrarchaeota archaeon]|nr:hypothetical protein [Candidatus Micrarchaeota archaeon]